MEGLYEDESVIRADVQKICLVFSNFHSLPSKDTSFFKSHLHDKIVDLIIQLWKVEKQHHYAFDILICARNNLITLLETHAKEKRLKDNKSEILILPCSIKILLKFIVDIFKTCLNNNIDLLNVQIPNSESMNDFVTELIPEKSKLAYICIIMCDNAINLKQQAILMKLIYSQLMLNHESYETTFLFDNFMQLGASDLKTMHSLITLDSVWFNRFKFNKDFKKLIVLNKILLHSLEGDQALLNNSILEKLTFTIHNFIFNSTYQNDQFLIIGYELFGTLGRVAYKIENFVELVNIIKVLDFFLLSNTISCTSELRAHYSSLLTSLDSSWQLSCIENWIFHALSGHKNYEISTRSHLSVEHINFNMLLTKILPMLLDLVVNCKDQEVIDYISSIFILLLNPSNINILHFQFLIDTYGEFITNVSKTNFIIYPECIKLATLYCLIGVLDPNICQLERYFEHQSKDSPLALEFKYLLKLGPLVHSSELWDTELLHRIKPFSLPYHICFQLLIYWKNAVVFNNLIQLIMVHDNLIDPAIDTLLYYESLEPDWFNIGAMERIIERLEDNLELDTNTSVELIAPLYPDCSEQTAINYTNVLANLVHEKSLEKNDLIIFDLFRFKNVPRVRDNLKTIFNNCQMSDSFVIAMVNRLANNDLLSEIVVGNMLLIEKMASSDNKWAIINGCISKPISQSNFNCLSIFSQIVCEKEYLSKVPTNVKDFYKTVLLIFYTRDHDKDDKLDFWDAFSRYSLDDHEHLLPEARSGLLEVWNELGFKKCLSCIEGGQRIIVDNDLTIVSIPKSKKKKTRGNAEAITTNHALKVVNSEGVDEMWPVTVTVYPKGKKVDIPDSDIQLRNKLFDNERKTLFLKQRLIGIPKKFNKGDISESYDYYQRILAFDLFRGVFEGRKSTGVLISSLFGLDCCFTTLSPETISMLIKPTVQVVDKLNSFIALLLIEFITIFIQRDIDTKFWSDKLRSLKRFKNQTVHLAASEALPSDTKMKVKKLPHSKSGYKESEQKSKPKSKPKPKPKPNSGLKSKKGIKDLSQHLNSLD